MWYFEIIYTVLFSLKTVLITAVVILLFSASSSVIRSRSFQDCGTLQVVWFWPLY